MVPLILLILTLIETSLGQILPGTIPSLPNPTLEGCQSDVDAALTNFTSNYTSAYAVAMDTWCRTYDEVLPCVDMSLPYTRMTDVNDWYLSMMFDLDTAYNISTDMCTNWTDYANDMDCIERSGFTSTVCIKLQTRGLSTKILTLYHKNETEDPDADLYACRYTHNIAKCMTKHMKYCSETVRNIIFNYFKLLNGKCVPVLEKYEEERRNRTAAILEKRQQLAAKMKEIMQARQRTISNTLKLQETIKKLFNEESAKSQAKINETVAAENSTIAETTVQENFTFTIPEINSNLTEEISANTTKVLKTVESVVVDVEASNATTIVKPKKKSRKRKKSRKSKKERVKAELKKLLKMVLRNL